jgi:hypothetical protein
MFYKHLLYGIFKMNFFVDFIVDIHIMTSLLTSLYNLGHNNS